jgi:hypothetical protein
MMSTIYRALQGPGVHDQWSLIAIALMAVGGFGIVIALLPRSWIEKACRIGPDDHRLLSVPIKSLASFAVFSYLLTVGLDFAPHSWHLGPQLVFSLCPACALSITVDPSLWSVLLLLAPMNAAIYGSLGATLGYALVALRNRR